LTEEAAARKLLMGVTKFKECCRSLRLEAWPRKTVMRIRLHLAWFWWRRHLPVSTRDKVAEILESNER
jgi:hypothetical protein